MDGRETRRNRKNNGNAILLTILIGFCVLAIIEIFYGQAQVRMQKERLALEEENHQTVQELKEEWNQLKDGPNVGTESVEAVGGEQNSTENNEKTLTSTDTGSDDSTGQSADAGSEAAGDTSVSANSVEEEKKYDMQIVFMGDSIIDNDREDGGVASLI